MKQQKIVPEEMDFVFIHGGRQAGWVWEEVLRALRLRHRTTGRMRALDIPGCGDKQRRDTAALTLPTSPPSSSPRSMPPPSATR